MAGLFALGGWFAVGSGDAATYVVDTESEDGTVQSPASLIADVAASGGSAVRFQAAASPPPTPPPAGGPDYSLRFHGNQTDDIDRVKVPLTPDKSIDVSGSFTLEWWMKTASGNTGGTCQSGAAGVGDYDWITGNVIFDRDINNAADFGKYGISLIANEGGRISFGVAVGNANSNICSTAMVADGQWHHVAATRSGTGGQICLYVDGQQSGCKNGPTGDISYRDARSSGNPLSDPYFVMAAEKHDFAAAGTGYHGWLDEIRLSNTVRYSGNFARPSGPFTADANTVALYHLDGGSGTVAADATGNNNGTLRTGGSPSGPAWSTDTPF